jgi:hypothetical protein
MHSEKFHEKILSEKKKYVMDSFIANFQTWDEINSKKKTLFLSNQMTLRK